MVTRSTPFGLPILYPLNSILTAVYGLKVFGGISIEFLFDGKLIKSPSLLTHGLRVDESMHFH